jgi:large subunit ribosomal protein L30
MAAAKLKIRQVRSPVKSSRKQRETLRSIGLGRIGKSTERPESPQLRGQLQSVGHLLEVEEG